MNSLTPKKRTKKSPTIEELKAIIEQQKAEIFRLKNVIAHLPGSIYWKDKNGVWLGQNLYAAEKMEQVGLADHAIPDAVIGKTDYDFFPKAVADQYRRNDMKVMNTGKILTEEEYVTLPDGKTLVQLSIKRPLYNESGDIVGIVGNTIDNTAKKEADELKKQIELVNEKVKLIESLGGSIAHELYTPLAAVNQGIDILMDEMSNLGFSPETVKKFNRILARTKHATLSCFNMIEVFLMNIRESEINVDDFTNCLMSDAITQALDEYPFDGDDKVLVRWHKENDFEYQGKTVLTKHILFNLIKNAIYFVRDAGKGDIQIFICKGENYNSLVFTDTGKGIARDFLPKIFDKFVSARPKGTGLGLAFCRLVMEAYGGSIKCSSLEGQYTQFILNFPNLIKNTNIPEKRLEAAGYSIFYAHEVAAHRMVETLLMGYPPYQLQSATSKPFIIDAGANIGISALYFKVHYPDAKILCFEPDPHVFKLLKKNIESNQLHGLTLVEAALSNQEGIINLYGQINVKNPDTRGNSIFDVWGIQRLIYDSIPVKSVKLSSYITEEVDFLKMDIEGAEQQVLEELGDKLKLIKAMLVEVHQAVPMYHINNLDNIVSLLKKYDFEVDIMEKDINQSLPEEVSQWIKTVNPKLFVVKAKRKIHQS